MKVALCLTVKGTADEAPLLDRCLKSVHKHIDGIFIQLNSPKGKPISEKVRQVAEKYTKPHNIAVFEWAGNFAKAKQANLGQVPKDFEWVIWLDADDEVKHPEKIKEVAAIAPKSIQAIFIKYNYRRDKFGNLIESHWNTRMVRNNGSHVWRSSIDDAEISVHETLAATRTVGRTSNKEFWIEHKTNNQRSAQSIFRNIQMMEAMYARQAKKQKFDPRTLFYLGRNYADIGRYHEAVNMLTDYLKISGWAQERSEAHTLIGNVLKKEGRGVQARTAYLMAIGEDNDNPKPFMELGRLDLEEQRYLEAARWLELALDIKQDVQTMNLFHDQYQLYCLLASTYLQIGGKKLSEALKVAHKALKLRPLDPEAKIQYEETESLVEYAKNNKAIARIGSLLKNQPKDIAQFVDLLPQDYQDSPIVMATRLNVQEPKSWPKKSIVIYCGAGPLGIWGPWSLEKGIGGSEEAVIQLSREMTKLGWQVHVYATPGDRLGIHDGVHWHQYWQINPKDEFDVLVAWRNPGFFDMGWKASRKYVWMHDVMPKEEFPDEVLENLDKVILLSDYHRKLFPNIPDNKIFLSANGIVPEDFKEQHLGRDPHRIIYMSSHVRGLEVLYAIWDDVKRAVPDAKLDIYYGWESFINILKDNPDRMAWRSRMIAWEKELEGVTDHGKISHAQIITEIQKSGIWAYPCPFPEIYCITAIKAQAGGAVPVSSNFAALKETVQFGAKIPMKAQEEDQAVGTWDKREINKFRDALIAMLKNPKKQESIRPKMMVWAKKQSWKTVAENWDREFK